MSKIALLPPALVELTWLRLAASPSRLPPTRGAARCLHQAVLRSDPSPDFHVLNAGSGIPRQASERWGPSVPALSSKRDKGKGNAALSKLEQRVEALKKSAGAEESVIDVPEYTEDQLLSFYEDVLAFTHLEETGNEESKVAIPDEAQDGATVQALSERLVVSEAHTTSKTGGSFSDALKLRLQPGADAAEGDAIDASLESPRSQFVHWEILSRVEKIVRDFEALRSLGLGEGSSATRASPPVAVVSFQEWEALIRTSIRNNDYQAAETCLTFMQRLGIEPGEQRMNEVMSVYAESGNVRDLESFVSRFITGSPSEEQRDLHITAHLKAVQPDTIPESALAVLHEYESRGLQAPMKSYDKTITTLFTVRSSVAHAQAWDLFSHMRYVAHPHPDAHLYTLMIRACASAAPGFHRTEPERALDLFTEMTVDRQIHPTQGAYEAVILACAKSGKERYVNEAFRLAKEMLDGWRDAFGRNLFKPERRLFLALLEGAKRKGELERARWILVQISRAGKEGEGEEAGVMDDVVMMHVFHAYASYRPPFRRAETVVVGESSGASSDAGSAPADAESHNEEERELVAEDHPADFLHLPPQTHSEVVREADSLFGRMVEDRDPSSQEPDGSERRRVFGNVDLSPRLLNAYLSVHYRHGTLGRARQMFKDLFERHNVQKNVRTYVEALERCAMSEKRERPLALRFAKEVWDEWIELEDMWLEEGRRKDGEAGAMGVDARTVERAHAAMIRTLTLNERLNEALSHIQAFVYRYPPVNIREPTPKEAMRSSRVVLQAPRPVVRLTSTTEVRDDAVPPLLTFYHLEVLHHRLVAAESSEAIAFVGWVCRSYEGALRKRRERAIASAPPRPAKDQAQVDSEV